MSRKCYTSYNLVCTRWGREGGKVGEGRGWKGGRGDGKVGEGGGRRGGKADKAMLSWRQESFSYMPFNPPYVPACVSN